MIGISNEPLAVIENFIADQGITFPVLRDLSGIYGQYNIPGGQSPYPRDFIVDKNGTVMLAKTEYDPGEMIRIIETLLDSDVNAAIDLELVVPESIKLLPNYPNPFNPATTLQFSIYPSAMISLDVINLKGRVVATIYKNRFFPAGTHRVTWTGLNRQDEPLSSGQYIVRLQKPNSIITQKITVMK